MPATDDFQQLALRFSDPVQHDYEVIRDIILFDATIAERSRITGVDRKTVSEKARRFLEDGMLGLVDRRTLTDKGQRDYPAVVASYILYIKQLYPPIHHREIARIIGRKFGYKTDHKRVQRFLARHPIPVQLPLPVTGYHQFEDAYRARWTVVRLYYEGWHQTSIAGLLKLSRQHVWHILRAFERDGFAGLEDQRTRPATHPDNQLSLPFLKEVLDVQREYPRAGRFRVRGLVAKRTGREPSETTIGRAMAINRRVHGAPPAWATDRPDPSAPDGIVKEMPFEPTHRHRYWFLDYRYLVRVGADDHWVYSLCVIEGYSRKILAGMATEYQDTIAVLQLLSAALSEYGQPEGIVSDNGSVFTSEAYEGLLHDLGIVVCHIEKGKPWQDLLEAQFKVQLRLSEVAFQQATTFEEVQERHATFVGLFNTTPHWAHRDRPDGLRTPVEVLGWVRGRDVDIGVLQCALRHVQVERVVNPRGYVSVQRFYIYAERGLARRRVSVWLYDRRLHVAHRDTLLARYAYQYDRKARRLRAVERPELYHTLYTTHVELWELDDAQWRKVMPRPYERRDPPADTGARQLPLPAVGVVGLVAVLLSHCLRYDLEARAGSAGCLQPRTAGTKAVT
jgi:putative transposase